MALQFSARVDIPDDASERLLVFENFCNATMATAPTTRAAMSAILDFIVSATGAVGAAIALPEADALTVSVTTAQYRRKPGERIAFGEIAGRAFLERKTYLANTNADPRTDHTRAYSRIGTTVVSPILHGRRAYGVLLTTYPASHGTHAKEARAVDEFSSIAGTVLGSVLYFEETGLGDRSGYERALAVQADAHKRFGVPLSVALFAAPAGDEHAAQTIVQTLRAAIRRTDGAFQIAEDRFAVVLTNCSERCASGAVKRIQAKLGVPVKAAGASLRRGENLRGFQSRLERELREPSQRQAPRAAVTSIWERFKP